MNKNRFLEEIQFCCFIINFKTCTNVSDAFFSSLVICGALCKQTLTCDAYFLDPDSGDCHQSPSILGHYQPQDTIQEQQGEILIKADIQETDTFMVKRIC